MEVSIHRFFSPAEVRQLEAGLPRLDEWSTAMLVPFEARRLRQAAILWINRRWFLERQLDITRDDVRERVSNWLLDEFAWMIPQDDDPQGAFTNARRTLHADRYGSSTGRTVHGGSGRVATVGRYQAKGVGVTPLVGAGGDAEHATGRCSIEESIREAILSEVAAAEFPHGAIPVVAILDTGLERAIAVRPAVLRIAHAERAPLFMRSRTGYVNSQRDDARRTREVVEHWSTPDLPQLVRRIAEQIAFGQVHRLFSGGYFSSNVSAEGALLDFGGMRALPNWVKARNLDVVVGFGDEMKLVNKLIESLVFYFRKYRPPSASSLPASALRFHAQAAYTGAFARECLHMWSVQPETDPALTQTMMSALTRYFSWQQKFLVNYKHSMSNEQAWLYDCIGRRHPGIESETLETIHAALTRHLANCSDRDARALHAWSCASRYLMPRASLDREKLKQTIERRLASDGASREWIAAFVQTSVGRGRRHWPRLPSDLSVHSQVTFEGSSVLSCVERATGRQVYWFEGIRVHDSFRLFDSSFSPEQVRAIGAQSSGINWTARVQTSDLREASWIRIPEMQVEYSALSPMADQLTRS